MDVLEREGKMGRRGFMQGLVATGLALAATSVIAAELSNFVEAKDGARGCWSRDYSAGHLADHPDQQVTSMRFTMQYDQDFSLFPARCGAAQWSIRARHRHLLEL
jgi:hypothetical protein